MSEPEPTYGQTEQKVESINRLATNRLATNRLATNRLATNRLATNSLTGLTALPETSGILSTWRGRDVYSYLIGCALPYGTNISATVPDGPTQPADTNPGTCTIDPATGDCQDGPVGPANETNGGNVCNDNNNDGDTDDTGECAFVGNYTCTNGSCTFFGSLGLAPGWLDHRLNNPGKGWVSACMFARVNAHAIAKGISLRGRHDFLATTPDERENFLVEEGAFYGNLFVDDPDPNTPPEWYACSGQGVFDNDDALGLRDCAKPNPDPAFAGKTLCGFNYAGECRDFDPTFASRYACRQFDPATTAYADCHETDGPGQWGGNNTKFRYVITSYVGN